MTDTIQQKALALVGDILPEDAYRAPDHFIDKRILWNALCRAIEQHEAYKREVSDAAVEYNEHGAQSGWLGFDHFIITEADEATAGLALAVEETLELVIGDEDARRLRAAIEARGGRIVWEGE